MRSRKPQGSSDPKPRVHSDPFRSEEAMAVWAHGWRQGAADADIQATGRRGVWARQLCQQRCWGFVPTPPCPSLLVLVPTQPRHFSPLAPPTACTPLHTLPPEEERSTLQRFTLTLQRSLLPSGRDVAAHGFPGIHEALGCRRSRWVEPGGGWRRRSGAPVGQGHHSSASLDQGCSSRLRLAAQEAVLGLESTRMHVLGAISCCSHISICSHQTHRAWLPGLAVCPLCGSVLCLCCSICLLHRLPGSAPLGLFISLGIFFLLLMSPHPSPCLCPTTFMPWCLRPSFLLCPYQSCLCVLLCVPPMFILLLSLLLPLMHIQQLLENPPSLFCVLNA